MARTKKVMQIHGISFKFAPLLFVGIVFLWFSSFVPDNISSNLPDFENGMISIAFWIGGLAFIYEGVYAWPKKSGNQSSMVGAIFFWVIGATSIIFGLAQWFEQFSLTGTGDLVMIAQIVLIADMIMLFIGTIFEIVMSHRLSHRMAGKPPMKILN